MPKEPLLNYFRGDGVAPAKEVTLNNVVLSDAVLRAQTAASGYTLGGEAGAATVAAVNVALVLRSPLLVAGEPGSGKTQLAFAVAHELGRPSPLKFVTKSTSQAQDLLYTYDAVQHFRAGQAGAAADARDYLDYSALGMAILLGLPLEDRRRFLAPSVFKGSAGEDELRRAMRSETPRQSVVLIDEIDKAPRDFPNDLLSELETMSFRVPELGGLQTPSPEPSLRPIVIITTNSERPLPDAFLRRCVYINLACPVGDALDAILETRLAGVFEAGAPLLRDVSRLFGDVRQQAILEKDPGLAELIQFLQALAAVGADAKLSIADQAALVESALPVLAKSPADHQRLAAVVKGWGGASAP